jgi:hypothetical protein
MLLKTGFEYVILVEIDQDGLKLEPCTHSAPSRRCVALCCFLYDYLGEEKPADALQSAGKILSVGPLESSFLSPMLG